MSTTMLKAFRRVFSSSPSVRVVQQAVPKVVSLIPFESQLAALEALASVSRTVSTRPALLEAALTAAPDGETKTLARVLRAGVVGAAMEPTTRTTSLVVRKLLAGDAQSEARIDDALALLGNPALRLPACGAAFANLIHAARSQAANTTTAAAPGGLGSVLRRIAIVARARGVEASGLYVKAGVSASVSAHDWPLALRFLKDGMKAAKTAGGSGAAGSTGLRRAAFKLFTSLAEETGPKISGIPLSTAQLKWCAETLPLLALATSHMILPKFNANIQLLIAATASTKVAVVDA
jgi:hypothetical protein